MAARTVDANLTINGILNATTVQQGGSAVELASHISTNGLGVVVHGATASTARPTGFAVVLWIGTIEPTNSINNDIWVDTDA